MADDIRIDVQIVEWAKYNPRKDVVRPTWYRLEYKIVDSLEDLTFEERWVFICLGSFSVEKLSYGHVKCSIAWFARRYGVSRKAIQSALTVLESMGVITRTDTSRPCDADVTSESEHDVTPPLRGRDVDVPLRDETRRYETERNETERNGTKREGSEKDPPPIRFMPQLAMIWNAHCGRLRPATGSTNERESQWLARWKENPDIDYWESVVKRMAASAFCRGEKTGGYIFGVEKLVEPGVHVKVMEGAYDDNASGPKADRAQQVEDANLARLAKITKEAARG